MRQKVVIMAGGRGERFWPYSRSDKPKQFLAIVGEQSLLQQTVARIENIVAVKDIYVVTGLDYLSLVEEQIPQIPKENIIVEPTGRDTAPCIGLSYTYLQNEPGDTVVLVLPADHLVLDNNNYCLVMEKAVEVAFAERKLVTIGIKPTRPETGYGYIKYGHEIGGIGGIYEVSMFTEKPDTITAYSFLKSGDYLWNSGMFAWRLDVIKEAYRKFLPKVYTGLKKISEAIGTVKEQEVLNEVFPTLPKVSIDYAILEKSPDVVTIKGDFGWDDLGSWTALERVAHVDEYGNIADDNVLILDTRNSIIRTTSKDKLITILGLESTVVVDTDDVLLVADKKCTSNIKTLVTSIKESGFDKYLMSKSSLEESDGLEDALYLDELLAGYLGRILSPFKQVYKPWGKEIWWSVTEDYVGKLIHVVAGHALSLQYHKLKRETMLFIQGSGIIELDGDKIPIFSGLTVDILPGKVHRVQADTDITFFEISTVQTDDVVRLDDRYGRIGQ